MSDPSRAVGRFANLAEEIKTYRDALEPFAHYVDINDLKERDPRGAIEVPIEDLLRAARALR